MWYSRTQFLSFLQVPADPFVHKPGEGPSSADLTGEHSDGGSASSKQKKKKAAEPSGAHVGTPLQQQVKGNKDTYNNKDTSRQQQKNCTIS